MKSLELNDILATLTYPLSGEIELAGQKVLVKRNGDKVEVTDRDGEVVSEAKTALFHFPLGSMEDGVSYPGTLSAIAGNAHYTPLNLNVILSAHDNQRFFPKLEDRFESYGDLFETITNAVNEGVLVTGFVHGNDHIPFDHKDSAQHEIGTVERIRSHLLPSGDLCTNITYITLDGFTRNVSLPANVDIPLESVIININGNILSDEVRLVEPRLDCPACQHTMKQTEAGVACVNHDCQPTLDAFLDTVSKQAKVDRDHLLNCYSQGIRFTLTNNESDDPCVKEACNIYRTVVDVLGVNILRTLLNTRHGFDLVNVPDIAKLAVIEKHLIMPHLVSYNDPYVCDWDQLRITPYLEHPTILVVGSFNGMSDNLVNLNIRTLGFKQVEDSSKAMFVLVGSRKEEDEYLAYLDSQSNAYLFETDGDFVKFISFIHEGF